MAMVVLHLLEVFADHAITPFEVPAGYRPVVIIVRIAPHVDHVIHVRASAQRPRLGVAELPALSKNY